VAAAVLAGCTTYELSDETKAKFGYTQDEEVLVTFYKSTGQVVICKAQTTGWFGGFKYCSIKGYFSKILTQAQIDIIRADLLENEETDQAAESTPVPGQIDTAVPGATTGPACVPSLYSTC